MPGTLTSGMTVVTGGVDPTTGSGQRVRIRVGGTWVAGDLITLTAFSKNSRYDLGNGPMMGVVPRFVMTYKDQIFVCATDKFYFSGIQEPTGFEDRFAGYGFIQISGQRGEALEAQAASVYNGKIALFARNCIQLWLPNADPDLWQLEQTLDNIGTASAKSVTSFGDMDIFFLADSGIRSVRSRENLDLATVNDVGLFIDSLMQAKTPAERAAAFGLYSTSDGRFWLCFSSEIYVFSYLAGAKIAAWTKYIPYIDDDVYGYGNIYVKTAVSKDGVFYFRGSFTADDDAYSDFLFKFPGTSGKYAASVTIVLPFFDAKKPATKKRWNAIDVSGSGNWNVSFGNKVTDVATFTDTYTALALPTEQYERLPIGQISTHLVIKFTQSATYKSQNAYISNVIIHYDELDAK